MVESQRPKLLESRKFSQPFVGSCGIAEVQPVELWEGGQFLQRCVGRRLSGKGYFDDWLPRQLAVPFHEATELFHGDNRARFIRPRSAGEHEQHQSRPTKLLQVHCLPPTKN